MHRECREITGPDCPLCPGYPAEFVEIITSGAVAIGTEMSLGQFRSCLTDEAEETAF